MIKKLFTYIFIYTLLVGCDTQNILTNEDVLNDEVVLDESCESDCYLEVTAPDLQIDDNGYYHMEFLSDYVQTFSTLDANTGSDEIVKVVWDSGSGIYWNGVWVDGINHASYTDESGVAHTVLAAWEEQIGDTLTVYAWYRDNCDTEHIDSIKVVIDNEI